MFEKLCLINIRVEKRMLLILVLWRTMWSMWDAHCLHSFLLRWGSNFELKLNCSLKNSMCWFVHLFDILVGFFLSCWDFCSGSACHRRVEVRKKEASGTLSVVMVSFVVVVLFGFIFPFNLWFVSFIVVFWAQCIVPLSAELWIVFYLWQSCFDHVAVKDVEHVCTRKSRIFSFCEGISGFKRFLCILSPALQSMRGVLWGLSGQIRLKEWSLMLYV